MIFYCLFFRKLTGIAFNDMNPFPGRLLRNRRALHLERLQGELKELEEQQREFVMESPERKDKELDNNMSEDDEELWHLHVYTNIWTFERSWLLWWQQKSFICLPYVNILYTFILFHKTLKCENNQACTKVVRSYMCERERIREKEREIPLLTCMSTRTALIRSFKQKCRCTASHFTSG